MAAKTATKPKFTAKAADPEDNITVKITGTITGYEKEIEYWFQNVGFMAEDSGLKLSMEGR